MSSEISRGKTEMPFFTEKHKVYADKKKWDKSGSKTVFKKPLKLLPATQTINNTDLIVNRKREQLQCWSLYLWNIDPLYI